MAQIQVRGKCEVCGHDYVNEPHKISSAFDPEKLYTVCQTCYDDFISIQKPVVICANEYCVNFDAKAVGARYPMSLYCSLKCKHDDPNYSTNNETYGD